MRISKALYPSIHVAACLTVAFTSAIVGSLIPGFYDWTESDQSRPSPLLWQVPLGWAALSLLACCVLPCLKIRRRVFENRAAKEARGSLGCFSIRAMLIGTTVVAVVVVVLIRWPNFTTAIIWFAVFIRLGIQAYKRPEQIIDIAALASAMVLPFVWLVFNAPSHLSSVELVWMAPSLPTLLPSLIARSLAGGSLQDAIWVPSLLTAFQLLVGLWCIELGPRRALAYILIVQTLSIFSSLVLLQLLLA